MSQQAQICMPILNLHSEPNETSEVVSQALYGWQVDILDHSRNFHYVQMADGYRGWVQSNGVRTFAASNASSKKVKVIYNAAPVYPLPHVKSKPLWILPFEVELALLAEPAEDGRRWIQVELIEGIIGWIQRGHISVDPPFLSFAEILQISRQFLGLPYIWGGTSSFGYDCSGFIQMLWRQRGIILPRDARQQFHEPACSVEWEALEAGDLLFYGSSEKEIRHVGLYIGHHRLIHASVKPIPIVQESDLAEPSLQQRFTYRTARRLPLK